MGCFQYVNFVLAALRLNQHGFSVDGHYTPIDFIAAFQYTSQKKRVPQKERFQGLRR